MSDALSSRMYCLNLIAVSIFDVNTFLSPISGYLIGNHTKSRHLYIDIYEAVPYKNVLL